MPKYTIAFAGPGESTLENTKALLNDYLGIKGEDADGYPIVPDDLDLEILLPVSDTHVTDSVMTVFEWTEYADLEYSTVSAKEFKQTNDIKDLLEYSAQDAEVANVNTGIMECLRPAKEAGRETFLFVFWGENGDEDTEILLDLATSAEIKVKDMTAGLDDVAFDEPNAPDPEPDPDPEPEKPARRTRGRARAAQEEAPKALEETPEPEPTPEPEKPARRRRGAPRVDRDETIGTREPTETSAAADEVGHEKVKPVPDDLTPALVVDVARDAIISALKPYKEALLTHLPDGPDLEQALINVQQSFLWAANAVANNRVVQSNPEEPAKVAGRPRKDGQPNTRRTAAQRAKTEIWDEDEQEWKPKGRGRIPAGSKTRLVDPKTGEPLDD